MARSPTTPVLEVLRENEDSRVLAHENILVVLWRRAPEAEACYWIYDLGVQHVRSLGAEKISVASVLPDRMPAPSPSVRNALQDLHKDSLGVVHRAAVVLPATGFIASAVRSVLLGATQRSSRRNGHGVFSSLTPALSWATEGLTMASGRGVSVPALVGAVERESQRPPQPQ